MACCPCEPPNASSLHGRSETQLVGKNQRSDHTLRPIEYVLGFQSLKASRGLYAAVQEIRWACAGCADGRLKFFERYAGAYIAN